MTMASNAGQSEASPSPALTLPTQAPSPPHPFLLTVIVTWRKGPAIIADRRGRRKEREKGSGEEKMGVWTTHRRETDRLPKGRPHPISQGLLLGPPNEYCIEDDADEQLVGDTSDKIRSYHLPSSLPVLAVTHTCKSSDTYVSAYQIIKNISIDNGAPPFLPLWWCRGDVPKPHCPCV